LISTLRLSYLHGTYHLIDLTKQTKLEDATTAMAEAEGGHIPVGLRTMEKIFFHPMQQKLQPGTGHQSH
jgi:hypothetical protein